MAKTLADKQNLDIDFTVQAAEQCEFPAQNFDVITANQYFLYFDITTITPLIAKWLNQMAYWSFRTFPVASP